MIGAVRQFFATLARGEEKVSFGDDDYRLAVAALLFHVMAIDGFASEKERAILADLLMRRFGLDATATEALIEAAATADHEAVDLYGFTSVLKRRLDAADRERLIEMMWEMVFADGKLHEFEDNLVWRVAELLGISSATRIALKQSVRGRAGP